MTLGNPLPTIISNLIKKHLSPKVWLGHSGLLGSFRNAYLPMAILPGCFSGWPRFAKSTDMSRKAMAKFNHKASLSWKCSEARTTSTLKHNRNYQDAYRIN